MGLDFIYPFPPHLEQVAILGEESLDIDPTSESTTLSEESSEELVNFGVGECNFIRSFLLLYIAFLS